MLNRPYVTLNIAMTADGKTDTRDRKGAIISSDDDMERVDRLRAQSDAVMVGGNTILLDDPRLTIKSADLQAERLRLGLEENPIKVGVISNAALRHDSRFLTAGPSRIIIFTTTRTGEPQITRLGKLGVQVYATGETRVDLVSALHQLNQLGVKRLMVEGGGTLNEELLKHRLVDEIFLYIAPLIFGGSNAPTFVDGIGLERQKAIRLHLTAVDKLLDDGVLLHYVVENNSPTHSINQGV